MEDPDDGGLFTRRSIGQRLGLPQSLLHEIQMKYHSPTRRKEAYLDAYTNQHPWPSWRKVVDVLLWCDCDRESEDVKRIYVQGEQDSARYLGGLTSACAIIMRVICIYIRHASEQWRIQGAQTSPFSVRVSSLSL